jgi:hypothetical protein
MKHVLKISEFKCVLENNQTANVGKLLFLSKEDEKYEEFLPSVWNILVESYKNVGGLKTYRNYNDFAKKKHHIAVVLGGNGDLLACATFRKIEESFKMVAIGCNQEDIGKLALQQIIQHTINKLELHYWAEVSDAIEHYFKKYNGYPMPNVMASKILEISEKDVKISKSDMVHYDRPIGKDREVYTKMIFGIKSDEIFQEVLEAVENYHDFMKEVNKMVNENASSKYSTRQAVYIIENLYRMHEEDGVNELTPNWNSALNDSLETLRNAKEKTEAIFDYIEYGEYLLTDMQPLVLHSMK